MAKQTVEHKFLVLPVNYDLGFPQTVRVTINGFAYGITYDWNSVTDDDYPEATGLNGALQEGGLVLTVTRLLDAAVCMKTMVAPEAYLLAVEPTTHRPLFAMFPVHVEKEQLVIYVADGYTNTMEITV